MSYYPSFETPHEAEKREREAWKLQEEERAYAAAKYYKRANFLVLTTMVVLAVPQLGLEPWSWHIVGVVALVVTVLAVMMMVKGRIGNGMLSLLFAWGILPGWIVAAPHVIRTVHEQYQVIAQKWREGMDGRRR